MAEPHSISSMLQCKKWTLSLLCIARIILCIILTVLEIQQSSSSSSSSIYDLLEQLATVHGETEAIRISLILFTIVTILILVIGICGVYLENYSISITFGSIIFLVIFIDADLALFYNRINFIGFIMTIFVLTANIWINPDLEHILSQRRLQRNLVINHGGINHGFKN
ncbi:uncharacterized protein LOC124500331 [Dermatophagoides farinae]|uniref:Uncharacterized protein n=1 Tax=Dermatophagoides farinae TaxID=6954 RepID=A0A9D4NVC0_DERFA|nr:uncharacterized protein LOC124500331 [Dermatophagoides farinae]KAH7639716.1 hypothetical protein HUG17_3749 [Dermatophagoides farinae]